MPVESIYTWRGIAKLRWADWVAMQVVIMSAILEMRVQPVANLEVVVAGHRDIAKIEQLMDVGAQQ